MADTPDDRPGFQMVGARAAILEGPIAEHIAQQIEALEDALNDVPDLAFDLSKTLVESVCKTVLSDIGHPPDPNWKMLKLLKETIGHFALLPPGHPNPQQGRESVTKTVRGLTQTIQGLSELRNRHGMASHGRDAYAVRLDLRQATLAAQAADTVVTFLYHIHRDARMQKPGARIHYEDHADFNDAFDYDNELIRLGEVELIPSRVLFLCDPEAYRAALLEFIAERDGSAYGDESAMPSEERERLVEER